jgi:peptidoglycan/LPS O-acetylase OafA/YrhL
MGMNVTRCHIGQLDGLRAIAVTAVIYSHCVPETWVGRLSPQDEIGMNAVYLFFVLSGYLITSQLLAADECRRRLRDGIWRPTASFYAKRILRLFPALYAALIVATMLNLPHIREHLVWYALQGSNILFALYPDIADIQTAGHLWSLSVEEQFYLVWPIIVFTCPRRWLWAAFGVTFMLGVYAWCPGNGLPNLVLRVDILTSLDSLALGALTALALAQGIGREHLGRYVWFLALIAVGGLILQALGNPQMSAIAALIAHEALNLIYALLIVAAVAGIRGIGGRLLNSAVLRYIGRISYSMYLYHLFLIATLQKAVIKYHLPVRLDYGLPLFAFIFAATVLLASVSWRFLEAPINLLKHRVDYRSRTSLRPVPETRLA